MPKPEKIGCNSHEKLVRAAVRAIKAMQSACEGENTTFKRYGIPAALEELTAALHSQPVRDEQVTIRGELVEKSDFVDVIILEPVS